MPDQPSKESLERERQWCFLQRQNGGDTISEAVHNCQQCDPGSLYYVLAFLREELRQQNAALVEALRDLTAQWNIIANTIDDGTHTTECSKRACDFRSRAKEVIAILGDAAPADAPEKGPQGGERIPEPKHSTFRDGEPCHHPGCLSHLSHPCEGCGRIGGHAPEKEQK